MSNSIDPLSVRSVEHEVETIFPARWSARAMNGEALDEATLGRLFEAARWAPSAFNLQPWRFVYATHGSAAWPAFLDLLVEGNRSWCERAGALIIVFSRTLSERDGKPAGTHVFDTGAAWQNLALQGVRMGLVVHGMAGFDWSRAGEVAKAPAHYAVQAMIAVGHPGSLDDLSESQREREVPSLRKRVSEISFAGAFAADAD